MHRLFSQRPMAAIFAGLLMLCGLRSWAEPTLVTGDSRTGSDPETGLSCTLGFSSSKQVGMTSHGEDSALLLAGAGTEFEVTFSYDPLPSDWAPGSSIETVSVGAAVEAGAPSYQEFDLGSEGGSFTYSPTGVYQWSSGFSGAVVYKRYFPPAVEGGEGSYMTYTVAANYSISRAYVALTLANPSQTPVTWFLEINGVFADSFGQDDVFNCTYDVLVQYWGRDEEGESVLLPSPDVTVRVFYYGSDMNNEDERIYSDEKTSSSDGHATVQFGSGDSPAISLPVVFSGPKLYVKAVPMDKTGATPTDAYYEKTLEIDSLKTYEGTLNLTVSDPDGNPLRAEVTVWGGMVYDQYGETTLTNESGQAQVQLGNPSGSSTPQPVAIHLAPKVVLTAKAVQHVESPPYQVERTPTFMMVSYELPAGAYSYEASGASNAGRLIVADEGGGLLQQQNNCPIAHPSKINAVQRLRGENRLYINMGASEELMYYDAAVEYEDKDLGAPDDKMEAAKTELVRFWVEREPKQKTFHVEFVVCRVGAWASVSDSATEAYFLPSSTQYEQISYMQNFFPMDITWSVNKNWAPATGAEATFSFNSEHLHNLCLELERYRMTATGTDFVVGIVPPGYLHTHSLFDQGGAMGLEFDDCPNAVLLDATKVAPHITMHEYVHTLGFADDGEFGSEPPSADGYNYYDQKPLINVKGLSNYPQYQDIMYDHGVDPWLSWTQYAKLLERLTQPVGYVPDTLDVKEKSSKRSQLNMILGGEITGTAAEPGLDLDPIYEDTVEEYRPVTQPQDGDLYAQFLGEGDVQLDIAYFRPARMISDPTMTGWDEGRVTTFIMALPRPAGLKKIVFGLSNHVGGIAGVWVTQDMSGEAPTVAWDGPAAGTLSGTAQLSWTGQDADSWTLYSWVLYSADGGATWRPVGSNLTSTVGAQATLTVDTTQLASSTQGQFKVLLSDGLLCGAPLLSPLYTISNPAPAPVAQVDTAPVTIATSGTLRCTIPVEIRNTGNAPLEVAVVQASLPEWLAEQTNVHELTVQGATSEILPLVVNLTTSSGGASASVQLTTNDPAHASFTIPITITQDHAAHAPVIARVAADPASALDRTLTAGALTVNVWALAGGSGLDARLRLASLSSNEVPYENQAMEPVYTQPGCYTWTLGDVLALGKGTYGVWVSLDDPQTGLSDEAGDNWPDPDLTFTVGDETTLPVFWTPTEAVNELTVQAGEEVELPYGVYDPLGGRLDLAVLGSPYTPTILWDAANNKLRWRPDLTQYRTWDIYLTARNELQAMRTAHWRVTINEPEGLGTAERAWNDSMDVHDGSIVSGSTVRLTARTQTPGQQGCIFQWRAVGETEWHSSPMISYDNPFLDFYWATWDWDLSSLPPATQYEIRTVNVNASGEQDEDAPVMRVWTDGLSGSATWVDVPRVVAAEASVQGTLWAQNQGGRTWTEDDGPVAALSAGSDFALSGQGKLEPWMQVPAGGQASYPLTLTAPSAPGLYTLSLELKDGTSTLGSAVTASVRVISGTLVTSSQLRSYLLGQWTPDAAWLASADMNADGAVDVADLVALTRVEED